MAEYADAKRALDQLHHELMDLNPNAARSLEEGMEETRTVHKLRVPDQLRRTLASTNVIESAFSIVETVCRNVKRWRTCDQIERWIGSGLLVAERQFRKVIGFRQIPLLLSSTANVRIPGQGEQDFGRKAKSDSGGKVNGFRPTLKGFLDLGMFFTGPAALDIITGTMNPSKGDQMRKLREVLRIRTQAGLPADRAKLRDRGEHRSQVPEACRGRGPEGGSGADRERRDHARQPAAAGLLGCIKQGRTNLDAAGKTTRATLVEGSARNAD
jgi:hypothetical protein